MTFFWDQIKKPFASHIAANINISGKRTFLDHFEIAIFFHISENINISRKRNRVDKDVFCPYLFGIYCWNFIQILATLLLFSLLHLSRILIAKVYRWDLHNYLNIIVHCDKNSFLYLKSFVDPYTSLVLQFNNCP